MTTAVDDLPGDADELRAAVLAMRVALDAERAERRRLEEQNERLCHFIRQLQRMQFGRRSEKLDPDQLNLALEDIEQAVAEADAEAEKADPPLRHARPRAPAEPRCFARPSAADRGGDRADDDRLPLLFRHDARHRRGSVRAP
jgi:hypothetical protein